MKEVLAALGACLALAFRQVVGQSMGLDSRGEVYRLAAAANAGACGRSPNRRVEPYLQVLARSPPATPPTNGLRTWRVKTFCLQHSV
jgi:hypothetical protein